MPTLASDRCADWLRRAARAALLVIGLSSFTVPSIGVSATLPVGGAWLIDGTGAAVQIFDCRHAGGDTAHDYFIGGYLHAIFERDSGAWEKIIHDVATGPTNTQYLPGLVWRSGMTDNVAELLLDFGKAGKFPPEALGIFSAGRTSAPISDGLFGEWLDFLAGTESFKAAATALKLASMSLLGGRRLSADQIVKVISQPALFAHKRDRADGMLTHDWFQLARALVKLDARYELVVLKILLENIGN